MWDDRWDQESLKKIFFPRRYSRNHRTIQNITAKYLDSGSTILEGGCGLGGKVYLLEQAGFNVIGIDYAKKSILRVHSFMPELVLGCGDLHHLPFKNDSFEGCWSFGVIEHFYNGYENIIKETHRVIRPSGYMFLAVPIMSKLRKMKAKLGIYPYFSPQKTDLSKFYQFAYDTEEIISDIEKCGFRILEHQGLNIYKGFFDEVPRTELLMKLFRKYLNGLMWFLLKDVSNHMALFVFEKRDK
jgi:SAM-dependent methyltransferase